MPRAGASRGFTGLVLAGATAGLVYAVSLASFFVQLTGIRGTRTSGVQVVLARGAVLWTRWQPAPGTPMVGGWSWELSPLPKGGPGTWWITWTPTAKGTGSVPLWAPLVASGVWLAWAARRWTPGAGALCRSCGYDCAGLAGDRCPECGTLRTQCESSTSQHG